MAMPDPLHDGHQQRRMSHWGLLNFCHGVHHLTGHKSASCCAVVSVFFDGICDGGSDADVSVALIKQNLYWSVWTSGAEHTG